MVQPNPGQIQVQEAMAAPEIESIPEGSGMETVPETVIQADSAMLQEQNYQVPEEEVKEEKETKEEQKSPFLQKKSFTIASGGTVEAEEPELHRKLQNLRGGGEPLPQGIQAKLEPAFGMDLQNVRIHRDEPSATLAWRRL